MNKWFDDSNKIMIDLDRISYYCLDNDILHLILDGVKVDIKSEKIVIDDIIEKLKKEKGNI